MCDFLSFLLYLKQFYFFGELTESIVVSLIGLGSFLSFPPQIQSVGAQRTVTDVLPSPLSSSIPR